MEVSGSVQGEEEVNLEYLRNVILQFLEHEKMRVSFIFLSTRLIGLTTLFAAKFGSGVVGYLEVYTTGDKEAHCEGLIILLL
jgi:GRIP domain